jgi:Glycosyl transferase family 90
MTDVIVPATGDTPRISVGWSEATIAEFRQLAKETPPDRHPIETALAPALLLAAEGDFGQAEACVLELMQAHAGSDLAKDPLFLPFFGALFVVQRLDLASRLLKERWTLDCAIELHIGAPSPGFACVRWEIVSTAVVRFVFGDSILTRDNTRLRILSFHWLFPLFADYLRRGAEATGTVDVSLWDTGLVPGLAFCSNKPDQYLIPDNLFISTHAYEPVRCAYRENDVPWQQRHAVAFWRGSTTGQPSEREIGWRSLPRIRLCELGRQNDDLIDAGISEIAQVEDPATESVIRDSGLMRAYLPAAEFNRYKYQIDIDGNTNSWPGLFQKLLTGSPVLKIASPSGHRQWYYDKLREWINFVPVAADMSDLVDKVRWLRDHDDLAHAIGEQGQALALSMDYEGELKRAGRTITAALHNFSGQPETKLSFGIGKEGSACLRNTWPESLKDGVATRGFESRLQLLRPVATEDFVLSLDLSPAATPPAPVPQRVTVVANGEVLLTTTLAGRQTLHCNLSRRTIEKNEALFVTLLHPDATSGASAAYPLDVRMVSVVLHGLSLTVARVHAAQQPAPATETWGKQSASRVADLLADAVRAGSRPKQVRTNHGTVVYADVTARQLRHGPPARSPANVFLIADGQTAYLLWRGPDGTHYPIGLGAAGDQPQASSPAHDDDALPGKLRLVHAADGSAFGLARNGIFLCAETDGRVTLSRRQLGPWECFHA